MGKRLTKKQLAAMYAKQHSYDGHQTGIRISESLDLKRKALPPGYRLSESGKVYFENRRNRSDKKFKSGYL